MIQAFVCGVWHCQFASFLHHHGAAEEETSDITHMTIAAFGARWYYRTWQHLPYIHLHANHHSYNRRVAPSVVR